MWFDSHCHLDAPEFSGDLKEVVLRAKLANLSGVLIPTVQAKDFSRISNFVDGVSEELPTTVYTLGIHPLYTTEALESDISLLGDFIENSIANPRFVGVGEVGLDYFVNTLDNSKQEWFFEQQLKLAKQFKLPVVLHVRRSQDQTLKFLRKINVMGGIAHAFNGSFVQARNFLDLSFKLGFGGSMTYERALQIRRLASELPIESVVLETDAPDIPPAWLNEEIGRRNEPANLSQIGEVFAQLRGLNADVVANAMSNNFADVFPRWKLLCNQIKASN